MARRSTRVPSEPRRVERYRGPADVRAVTLKELLAVTTRGGLRETQFDLLRSSGAAGGKDDVRVFYAGDISILNRPCVSVVGTREVSEQGAARARRLARELAQAGIVVVSGLARGVDTEALTSAMASGGRVAAVIGTPLAKAYPIENAALQEEIWHHHVLLTPFGAGEAVFKSNFPKRNRVMAALSDATVIVEASDTSGTLHQAAECQRLGRWLFIARSVVDDPKLSWPKRFLGEKCVPLDSVQDVVNRIANA
jgi:DNA processing protein